MIPAAELDQLLSRDPAETREWERTLFDSIAGSRADALVLMGSGGLGRRTLAGLRRLGMEPLAFADNSQTQHGKTIDGVKVFSVPEAVARFNESATFVVTIWSGQSTQRQRDFRGQLEQLGAKRIAQATALFAKHPETFLPFYALDLPSKVLRSATEVRRAFDLLADDLSRREFVAEVRWRLLQDFDGLSTPHPETPYFCDSIFAPDPAEDFIDCGAFDGDTLLSFVRKYGDQFARYTALEPDPLNMAKLRATIASLPPQIAAKVDALPYATGERRQILRFEPTGTAGTVVGGGGSLEAECLPLDELLNERRPTYVKMDIEGAEFDTLSGARRTIERVLPLLGVCVYHLQEHLWTIPLRIHEYAGDRYRYALRPHWYEGWDRVLYAVPRHRFQANG